MKNLKRILIAAGLLGVAVFVAKLGDKATGWTPPPPREIPAGASLVQGAPVSLGKGKPVELSFDLLKKWFYVAGKSEIPPFIRSFNGQYVQMTGYMMPMGDIKEIKSFVFVPSLFGCCYGQPPAVNHVVLVKMAGDKRIKFYNDAIRVSGQFHCGEEKQDGYLVSLYRLDADQIVAK